MIYSRWSPTDGQYDYYEAPMLQGLNDDLPEPRLPAPTELGVPSVECGRPMPAGARHTGRGELPKGLITHPAGIELFGALGLTIDRIAVGWFFAGVAASAITYWVWRRWR